MRRTLLLLIAVALPAAGDNSLPQPSPSPMGGSWQSRCAERLRQAQRDLTVEVPAFAAGEVTVKHGVVHFEALIADREHARFFNKPAHYFVRVEPKRSKEPGAIGADVGKATDEQASLGISRWSKQRFATLDVQIADGHTAFRFSHWFKPALADCLR